MEKIKITNHATKTPPQTPKTKLSTSIGSFEIEIWENKAVVENLVTPLPPSPPFND